MALADQVTIKRDRYGVVYVTIYKDPRPSSGSKDIGRDYIQEAAERARRKVLEYALNNKWSHFITITLDDRKINDYYEALDYIRLHYKNRKYRKDPEARYLIIPEYGAVNGRLHYHGLVYHGHDDDMTYLYYDRGRRIYRYEPIYKRLGANQYIPIVDDKPYIAYYIAKYIAKDMDRIYPRYYYASHGLRGYERLYDRQKKDMELLRAVLQYIDGRAPNYGNEYMATYKLAPEEFCYLLEVYQQSSSPLAFPVGSLGQKK